MNSCVPNSIDSRSGGGRFEQTQWTIILRAREVDAPGAADAMETFARTYWAPIYRYIRREGYNPHDAQDLTQGFYAHFLEKQLLSRVGERTGKFRNYLLTCLKHFLSDERDRAQAQKRLPKGGFISRDAMELEERDAMEPSDHLTPDQIFERRWIQSALERAQEQLRESYEARRKLALYQALKNLPLGEKTEITYAEIAQRLQMTEQAIKNAAISLRGEFFKILRKEIERTVGSPEEVDEEIRHLIAVFTR